MNKGLIIKGIAGFYYVKSGESVYRCRARGVFKQQEIKLAVGDEVEFEIIEGNDDSWITELYPRKNEFIRPFVSNVDCFVIVTAALRPAPILATIDRFLVMAERAGTDVILCINKCDLARDGGKGQIKKASANIELMREIYEPIYPVVCTDSMTGTGIEELKSLLKGKRAALAGASGVGKSTLLNQLIPQANMETGNISEKSQRGKHTTRHTEIFEIGDEFGTMIYDTPGFTSFDILEAEEDELQHYYPEIAKHIGNCKYDNCMHIAEPECSVKEALKRGEINENRYESYKQQLEAIKKSKEY